MLFSTASLLSYARQSGFAIGAFNVYNLEGARAVIAAAEAEYSPVMLQILPKALALGGAPLIELCQTAARLAVVPAAVHLDHSSSTHDIQLALHLGLKSVMADGSHLLYADNVTFVRQMVELASSQGAWVEAELGRLTGTEDGLTVAEYEARMTDPAQAQEFLLATGAQSLAVCIGNIHGDYPSPPVLDFDRLESIAQRVSVPLVLHGASGLPEPLVQQVIRMGVCKLNVNTELRRAYTQALHQTLSLNPRSDLVTLMGAAAAAMQLVVQEKLRLFGSSNQAHGLALSVQARA